MCRKHIEKGSSMIQKVVHEMQVRDHKRMLVTTVEKK